MLKKENKLIITFHTTTKAMSMEQCCKEYGAPGRLIPVPKAITAGCGMAWCANPEHEELLTNLMAEHQIIPQELRICLI